MFQTFFEQTLHGYLPSFLIGARMTLYLSLSALVVGMLLGLLGAACKLSPRPSLRALGGGYSMIVRGVPETVWVLIIYFGTVDCLNNFGAIFGYPDLSLPPFLAGTIALGLCFGAYSTEVFRGALLTIPKGQIEAGVALGLSKWRIFYRISLPQVWRLALSGLGNLYLILIKDTALVSLISQQEIMFTANGAANITHQPFTFYLVAAVMYMLLTVVITSLLQYLEHRANRGYVRNML